MPYPRPVRSGLLAGLALLSLVACGDTAGSSGPDVDFSDVDTSVDLGDVAFDAPEPDECAVVDRVTAVRLRSVPGGRQLHVLLADEEGRALDARYVSCLSVEDVRLGALPSTHTVVPTGPGATLIVARWTPEEVDTSRAFIDAFVATRPDGERVAVWAWSDALRQVVGPTADRERLRRRLDMVWTADDAAPASAAVVAAEAAETWEQISDQALMGPRSIVFVAPALTLDALPELDRDWLTDYWAVGAGTARRVAPLAAADDAGQAAAAVADAIDAAYTSGLGMLGFCDDGEDLSLMLLQGDRVVRRFGAGDAAQEHKNLGCSLQTVLDAAPVDQPVIEIDFTSEQRAHFDQLSANRDGATHFGGLIRLDASEGQAVFDGSFRGQSSMRCQRKNMTIDLDGADARHVIPSSGTDEFFLISMCLDDRYVNQLNADRLLQRLGAWQVELGTVELRIDEASWGVYAFVEKVDDELRNDITRLRSVIRRRTDIDGKPAESQWAFDGDDAAAVARYDAFLASFDGLSGDALVGALRQRMDLDQYLRWMAAMTLLGNGDYVDEVFFVAEESVGPDHAITDYYTIQAWDPDDIFSACHHDSRFAITDPNGLLYCAESVLDHRIFADPVVYDLYVETLEQVMAVITPEVFDAQVEATRDELLAWFEDDELRGAMIELIAINPSATERDVAAQEITTATDTLITRFRDSRERLTTAIATYRGTE